MRAVTITQKFVSLGESSLFEPSYFSIGTPKIAMDIFFLSIFPSLAVFLYHLVLLFHPYTPLTKLFSHSLSASCISGSVSLEHFAAQRSPTSSTQLDCHLGSTGLPE
jgi:hypothetical protein